MTDDEMLDEGVNLAGWVALGGYMSPKPVGALAAGGARVKPRRGTPEALGYAPDKFYRGEATGARPNEYAGAFFSRDPDYATGFAQRGGHEAPREFRLNLEKTFRDSGPVTADVYARLVNRVAENNPKVAADMVDMIAPGKTIDWFNEFAGRNGGMAVAENGALVRQMVDQAASYQSVFKAAGFDAIDTGRDVQKLTGDGIRLATAKFDPKRKASRDITAGLAGLLGYEALYDED